jgi:hypothetical protein
MANGDLDLCQADGHRQRTTHGTADPMNTVNVVANVWIWIPLRRDETVAGLCRLTARLADLDAADIETLRCPARRRPLVIEPRWQARQFRSTDTPTRRTGPPDNTRRQRPTPFGPQPSRTHSCSLTRNGKVTGE